MNSRPIHEAVDRLIAELAERNITIEGLTLSSPKGGVYAQRQFMAEILEPLNITFKTDLSRSVSYKGIVFNFKAWNR